MSAISIAKGSIALAGLLWNLQNNLTDSSLAYNNATSQSPAIVVVHPGGGVKEQVASLYARKLAEKGFVTVAYDASHQGESGGLPRHLEDPGARVSDINSVIDYLEQQDFVDRDNIAVLGICAGGPYAVAATTGDHRIKALATVSAVNIGDVSRRGWFGTDDPAGYLAIVQNITQQVTADASSDEPQYEVIVPDPPTASTPGDLVEASEYYLTARGYWPTAQNKRLVRSTPLIATADPYAFADLYLTQPALLVAGSIAQSLWHTERLEQILGDNARKVLIPGANHMDLYDQLEYVNPAIEEIASFFKAQLV